MRSIACNLFLLHCFRRVLLLSVPPHSLDADSLKRDSKKTCKSHNPKLICPNIQADETNPANALSSSRLPENPVSPGIVSDSAPEACNRRKQRRHSVFRESECRTFPDYPQANCLDGNNLDLMKNKSFASPGQYLFLEGTHNENPRSRILKHAGTRPPDLFHSAQQKQNKRETRQSKVLINLPYVWMRGPKSSLRTLI